ncbi:hypothetical protein BGZ46_002618 [Entomortierella lignicola]|nr:hypothetical protein BGZ46_002618 [Entomortierella lignicola]
MLKFMQDFKATRSKQDQDENSLADHIDMEAKAIGYEELLQLETRSDLSTEEYYGVQKFKIMDAYGIENPSVLTPEWINTYSDPKEMKVFRHLQALKDDPELKMVKQNDSYPLGKGQERKNAVAVLHRLHQSTYTKLKYAKDDDLVR